MLIDRAYAHLPDSSEYDRAAWPWSVPCVRQLLDGGLRFTAPITFLVGENGSGKSTLVEALAEAYGLDSYGGSAGYRYASSRQPSPLGTRLRFDATAAGRRMVRGPRTSRKGFFLRAETALDALRSEAAGKGLSVRVDQVSHGEGFLATFRDKFHQRGLYVLDEPEAALSFASCLQLVGVLYELGRMGAQVICATHSPLLTAMPGAEIVEVGEHGMRSAEWQDLAIVDHWRRYLADPNAYLRHVID
ncbi:AAA family ATPase [Streptomyces sp. 7N604]|uniref:AAA family ATPase n=1 Tax=Streptomyces sp. 7N604 TaxID=3457415 RepID=UPI003FD38173